MIALKRENFDIVKKEFRYIALLFLIALAAFKIAFFKDNLMVLLRSVLSLFWLFILPGYFIMLYWSEKIGFLERVIAGALVSAAVIGIFSYYIGLIGLDVKYHAVILPLALILGGILINFKR